MRALHLILCWRLKNAWHAIGSAPLKPRPLFDLAFHKLSLTLLLHHPRLNDVDQGLNLLFCIARVQTDPYPLPAFRYSRRHDTTHYEAF
jgi:hypothetical protein